MASGRISFDSMERSVKIDAKDDQLLALLAQNAREPLASLAKKLKLSPDAVAYRVKRLEKENVILRFYANLNFEILGFYLFHVFFLLDELDKNSRTSFFVALREHPNVRSVLEYNDRWDIEVVLMARSLREFDEIILDLATQFPKAVLEKDKVEIIKRYTSKNFPLAASLVSVTMTMDAPHLEEVDWKILALLAADGRMSAHDVGEAVGVSADTVRYKIKHYLSSGIISNFSILVDLSLLNYQWYTHTVELKVFDKKNEARLQEYLRGEPNVIRCIKTLGGWDLLFYIVVKKPKDYHTIIRGLKHNFADIMRSYQTWLAYEEHEWNACPKAVLPQGVRTWLAHREKKHNATVK